MTAKTLKDLYRKNKEYLAEDIDLNLLIDRFLLERENKKRKQSPFFHPSLISKGIDCEYWWYYQLSGAEADDKEEAFSAELLAIMAIGSAIHDKYQEMFYDMGILEGVWECVSCGHQFWAISPKDQCPECRQFLKWKRLKFKEVPMESELFRGHADGILNFSGTRSFLELKSIKNVTNPRAYYGFELLDKHPIEEHNLQAQIYMDMWHDTFKEVTAMLAPKTLTPTMIAAKTIGEIDNAVVLYAGKNGGKRKAFVVKRNEKMLSFLKATGKKIKKAYLLESLEELTALCPTLDDKELKNKKCKFKKICNCCQ